jgi:hypothetical protein
MDKAGAAAARAAAAAARRPRRRPVGRPRSCPKCPVGAPCNSTSDCVASSCLQGRCARVYSVAYNERVSVAITGGATSATTSAALGDTLLALLPPRAVDGATVVVSPPCKTEGGWAPTASECALPFVVGGVSYSSCAPASVTPPYLGNSSSLPPLMPPSLLDVYWCPTSANYDAGDVALRERWGFCFCDTFWTPARSR